MNNKNPSGKAYEGNRGSILIIKIDYIIRVGEYCAALIKGNTEGLYKVLRIIM